MYFFRFYKDLFGAHTGSTCFEHLNILFGKDQRQLLGEESKVAPFWKHLCLVKRTMRGSLVVFVCVFLLDQNMEEPYFLGCPPSQDASHK